jgi:hypothetical protein
MHAPQLPPQSTPDSSWFFMPSKHDGFAADPLPDDPPPEEEALGFA